MKILITNDDGYNSKGLKALVEMLRPFGTITVVAPKHHQSGMSMAISLGFRQIAVKQLSCSGDESWWYLDGTPASCVKFGLDNILTGDRKPDVVISGVNHGSNAGTASLYSATVGGAQEAAVNGIPAMAVSLDDFSMDADFSTVRKFFPDIFRKIMENLPERRGVFYNINFPNLPADEVKGVRTARMGYMHWVDEYVDFEPDIYERRHIDKVEMGILFTPEVEPGEKLYMMAGSPEDSEGNDGTSDHLLVARGYITIMPLNLDNTDFREKERLLKAGFEKDF